MVEVVYLNRKKDPLAEEVIFNDCTSNHVPQISSMFKWGIRVFRVKDHEYEHVRGESTDPVHHKLKVTVILTEAPVGGMRS